MLYGFIRALKYPKELYLSTKYMFNQRVSSTKEHIKLSADWLLRIQNGDGGYSRKFSLIGGWDKSYIETTGYIIPTLFEVAEYLEEDRYKKSALKAGEWLLSVQNDDGSFSEIDTGKPFVFDTGQVLLGLNRLYKETADKRFFEAAKKASCWLMEQQESDGSWQKAAYNTQKHTYYSRVAAAMYEYAVMADDEAVKKSALKHIEWVLSNQRENGFFRYASFDIRIPAYLHTIVYTLEGLLDIYALTKQKTILDAVLKMGETLKKINLTREKVLCSQYNESFECINPEKCITGLAQWAGVALRLHAVTGDESYRFVAVTTLFYLKSKQIREGGILKGALSASIPFWGRYGAFDFVNWNNKFFCDSLMLLHDTTPSYEQEMWSRLSFMFHEGVVTKKLTKTDRAYIKNFDTFFSNYREKHFVLLDLGCGRGKFLDYFRSNYPQWSVIGVDPVFEDETANILCGSAYSIPLEDRNVDIVFVAEVLQHTYIDDAFKEIRRVLKKGGLIVIGERNPFSILGFLKPFFELSGRWMYRWDDPFKERWYSVGQWKKMLERHGFETKEIVPIEGSGRKFVNRYFFVIGRKCR
jgi:ubiquinone/menaquinone biosynthesis C-methylase UbiE